jgi:hypothetical protein
MPMPDRPTNHDSTSARRRLDGRLVLGLVLVAGLAAIAVAMLTELAPDLVWAIASPPKLLRAVLAGGAIVIGIRLLLSAVRRIDGSMQREGTADGTRISDADLGSLVRGVRLVFLSAASLTAAAGWILGEPLPLVIALVIAGEDVVETSFLLLVASGRSS